MFFFLNLINFDCVVISNLVIKVIVPEKPHWGGNNKVCMYVILQDYTFCTYRYFEVSPIDGEKMA